MADPDTIDDSPGVRRTLTYYLVLVIFVFPIWGIVPASWAYVVYTIVGSYFFSYSLGKQALFLLACCEVVFSIYYQLLAWRVGAITATPNTDVAELRKVIKRILRYSLGEDKINEEGETASLEWNDPRAVEYRKTLRIWLNAPWSDVPTAEVKQWLYWFIFNARMPSEEELSLEHRQVLQEALELMEKRAGGRVPEGSNPSLRSLRLTIDPFVITHRPLAWYVYVKVVNSYVFWQCKRKYGLRRGRFGKLEYALRIPDGYNRVKGRSPVVFLHGLGLGIWQYQIMLRHFFEKLSDTPFLVILNPQTSQDFFHPLFLKPMLPAEMVASMGALLESLGWVGPTGQDGENKGVTILSHSNGSFAHGWLLKSCPKLISRSCFVDPVSFCVWEGDVCANFVYRQCTTGMDLIIRFFVGTELGVACLLRRHFNWVNCALWFEEIPEGCNVKKASYLLSGNDTILNVRRTKSYLESHGVTDGLWYERTSRHGQSLCLAGTGMDKIFTWLKDE